MVHFAEINQVPSLLLNVAKYSKNSNTSACAKKLSQILANSIDHGGREIVLRIYVRHCGLIPICRIE